MPSVYTIDEEQVKAERGKPRKIKTRPGVETKKVMCASCDASCNVTAEVQKGRVVRVRSSDNPIFKDNICMKAIVAPKGFSHPDRLMKPLRRVGERGSNQWEEVTWDDAMADIGKRLGAIIEEHGPEAWAVATSQWNTSTDSGLGRRIMNNVGSPNWISGVALCAGNTAAINRMTYGWFPWTDYTNTNCIVLYGHNPRRNSWVPIYNQILRAKQRGAKIIVLDPRKSSMAERADIWLPLRAGTDAAMTFGWLDVIIKEKLYDEDFVKSWTVGFEELCERVAEYPVERVAEITGCDAEQIREAARTYATCGPSVIPWTPITDMQRNSTSAIRLHGILRAICGYLDVPGGELFQGLNPDIVSESEIEQHENLSEEQKAKQLGYDNHPAFTHRAGAYLREPSKKVWGLEYPNQVTGCYMANPSETFRAMAGEGKYPVKAFFSLGNNTLMSFANSSLILKAMLNQDLIVVHEQFMTPTAQLADYVLPADSWLERPWLHDAFGWSSMTRPSQKAMEPMGECESTFSFWKRIAESIDRSDLVPWDTLEDFYDWRLERTGMTFEQFSEDYEIYFGPTEFRKYEKTGFATPSGKVELKSSILENLGFDSLPYFRDDPVSRDEYPLMMFTGVREDEYFQTGHRHIPELRERNPEPIMFVSPATAVGHELSADEWVEVSNPTGKVSMKVGIREAMPDGLVRIPHGWWKPEMERGYDAGLSGAMTYADAFMCPDDDDYLDREQGIPHLKGIPCRIDKLRSPPPGASS